MSVALTRDLDACFALRRTVFTLEQGVSEAEEIDGRDDEAVHFLAVLDGSPVGTARVLVVDGAAKIGRVCVLPQARGTKQGQALIRAALDWARAQGLPRAILGAQLSALGFYEALGFVAYGEVFDDAGIDHRMMEIRL